MSKALQRFPREGEARITVVQGEHSWGLGMIVDLAIKYAKEKLSAH